MNKILLFLFLSFSVFAQKPFDRFEKEIRAFEKLDSLAMPAKGMKLFIGSSSFRLWKSFDADTKGMNAFNRGFGGSTFKDALYYFDRMVVKYQPSWVFVYEGDNDLASGQSPEEIAAQFEEFSNRLAKQVLGAKLVFVSARPSLARETLKAKQQDLNQRIAAISSKKKGHFVIDMHSPFYNADGTLMQDIFVADRLHLNEKGYVIFAKQIQNFLQKYAK
jgi:lysophospholipase L1-like esterase